MNTQSNLREDNMDTNLEMPTQAGGVVSQPQVLEPTEIETQGLGAPEAGARVVEEVELSGGEDFEAEAGEILSVPGTAEEKLMALAADEIEHIEKDDPIVLAREMIDKDERSIYEQLFELQRLAIEVMLMDMKKEFESKKRAKELLEKIKKLINEASGEENKNSEIVLALMSLLSIIFHISEKGINDLEIGAS